MATRMTIKGSQLRPGDVYLGNPGRVITEALADYAGRYVTQSSYRTRSGAILRLLPHADYAILRPEATCDGCGKQAEHLSPTPHRTQAFCDECRY